MAFGEQFAMMSLVLVKLELFAEFWDTIAGKKEIMSNNQLQFLKNRRNQSCRKLK